MDFSLTTMFVVPNGTLASAGSTEDLTPNQLGIFRPDYSLATAGNIAAAKYFFLAQGRPLNGLTGMGSKKSDHIHASRVIEWVKETAEDTAANSIATISGFSIKCGEDVHFSVRFHSKMAELIDPNGITRTVTVKAPCCDCGELPCEDILAADTEALVDLAVAKLNADEHLKPWMTFSQTGTGASAGIIAETKPLTQYNDPFNQFNFPPETDRAWFRMFVYKGPALSVDWVTSDQCNIEPSAAITQRSTYIKGTSAEIKQLERQFFSYQTSHFKHLHKSGSYNGAYETAVVDGTFYDVYTLKFQHDSKEDLQTWSEYILQDSQVILAFPVGQGAAFETVMTAALGAPKNVSGADVSTTTTTSTSTTTTTSTTVVIP